MVAAISPQASSAGSLATVGKPASLSSVWKVRLIGQTLAGSHISVIHPAFTTRSQLPGIGLVTGQVGLAWNAALLYVKDGAAVTVNTYEILTTVGGDVVATAVTSRWGGTVGVGIEYGFGPNWSAGIEYNHLFMGSSNSSVSATVVNPIVPGALNRISQDLDIVTIRANYRFGGSVVAGY